MGRGVRGAVRLARYLPAALAERMAEADAPFGGDRRAVAAILFTDVVGFTGWAEGRDPAEVAGLLREVHGAVADQVFRAGGVLDKFIGDGAMASFGLAPQDPAAPDPADLAARALGCAEAILSAVEGLNRRRAAAGQDPVRLSVGLHLGPVVVGDVGAEGRMELATVGDAVNVASRIEALTRVLGCAACASGAVIEALPGDAPPPGWRFAARPCRSGPEAFRASSRRGRADRRPSDPATPGAWQSPWVSSNPIPERLRTDATCGPGAGRRPRRRPLPSRSRLAHGIATSRVPRPC